MSGPKVFLNPYRKKDGTCAVYTLVHIGGESIKFPTGINCDPEKFNDRTGRIKGMTNQVKDDNLVIEKCLARINEIFVKYRLQGEAITPDILKKEWKNPARRINFYAWMEEAIAQREGDITESSLKQHKVLVSKMKEFRPKLSFPEIDPEFIESFRRSLKVKQKNDLNTIHNNLKNLKAYLNIALRQGVIRENPFNKIKLKRSATERIFLSEDELYRLWEMYARYRLPSTYHYVLRHFLFMCFTGLRISDMMTVTFDNIISDQLVYFPVKTRGHKKTGVKVPLNRFALKLIEDEGRTTGNLFNCISEQQMNLKIKEIAKGANIAKKLSNHSGRHTFSTIYIQKTKDVVGLQRLLGHSRISETMIYVHLSDEILTENMKVFEAAMFHKNPRQLVTGTT